MRTITIYGSGCANCQRTEAVILQVITAQQIEDVTVMHVTDIQEIIAAGVLSTPAVALDGTMLSSGRIPRSDEVRQWLTA